MSGVERPPETPPRGAERRGRSLTTRYLTGDDQCVTPSVSFIVRLLARDERSRAAHRLEDVVLHDAPALRFFCVSERSSRRRRCPSCRAGVRGSAAAGSTALQALLQIAADEALHGAAVRADHLRQEILAHQRLAGVLLLGDHLQQDRARDVFLALLVDDDEIDLVHHQPPDVGERDVAALDRVVEAPVRIFLDDSRLAHVEAPRGSSELRTGRVSSAVHSNPSSRRCPKHGDSVTSDSIAA